MLYWTIQVAFFSIIFILLVHHILHFLKSTLTVPKVKDLVNTRNQKYETIYNIVSNPSPPNIDNLPTQTINIYDKKDSEPINREKYLPSASYSMKDELKHFLKEQLHEQLHSDTTDISALGTVTEVDGM